MSMQVAILNGITMGGGAGVSIPGTFRIATDKTVRTGILVDIILCFFFTNLLAWQLVHIPLFFLNEETINYFAEAS